MNRIYEFTEVDNDKLANMFYTYDKDNMHIIAEKLFEMGLYNKKMVGYAFPKSVLA